MRRWMARITAFLSFQTGLDFSNTEGLREICQLGLQPELKQYYHGLFKTIRQKVFLGAQASSPAFTYRASGTHALQNMVS